MKLTRQFEIAVGILVACARAPDKPLNTLEAAEMTNATKDHAARVVWLLANEGFIRAKRGRNGGIALAMPPEEIKLGEVFRRIEGNIAYQPNTGNFAGHNPTAITFGTVIDAAESTFLLFMDRFNIADLLRGAPVNRVNCQICNQAPISSGLVQKPRIRVPAQSDRTVAGTGLSAVR